VPAHTDRELARPRLFATAFFACSDMRQTNGDGIGLKTDLDREPGRDGSASGVGGRLAQT